MNRTDEDALQAGQTKTGHKVLVVDDDQDFAAAMVDSLEVYGYTARVAGSAESAMAIAKLYRPDGLLLDLRLGDDNGMDLLPSLRDMFPSLVVIIVTGYPDVDTAIGALRHRADDYFRKPFVPEDLCKVLKRCFGRIQARRRGDVGQARENFFGRLLVQRFADLFMENDIVPSEGRFLSRRILPGFFVAVDMMLGPEQVEEYQGRCREIVRRISDGDSARLSWDDYYADREANDLALQAQVQMALHFREIDKRIVWLTTLINNHVGAITHQPVAQAITSKETAILLSYLFKDLSDLLSSEDGRTRLFQQYGQETFMRLARVADRFRPVPVP